MSKAISKPSNLVVAICGALFLVAVAFVSNSGFIPVEVDAQTSNPMPVTGHAWSDTIGWIEFAHNKSNKVTITSDGYFQGYAWSDNIGWLKFDKSLAGPGGGSGARLVNDKVVGWARFCAGQTVSPTTNPNNTCTGASRTDGWDGWVKFDHSKSNEVAYNPATKKFTGFAWGSDVVGWVDMSLVGADLSVEEPEALVVSCSASPSSLGSGGGSVTFRATASGGSGSYTYEWDNGRTGSSFSETVSRDTTHEVEVSDGTSTESASCSVDVQDVPPPADLNIQCLATVPANPIVDAVSNLVNVTWNVSVTGGNGPYQYSWDGAGYSNNSSFTDQYGIGSQSATVNVRDARGTTGSKTCQVTVREATPPTQQVDFTFSNNGIVRVNCDATTDCSKPDFRSSVITVTNTGDVEATIRLSGLPSGVSTVFEGQNTSSITLPVGGTASFGLEFGNRLPPRGTVTYNLTATGTGTSNTGVPLSKIVAVKLIYTDSVENPR